MNNNKIGSIAVKTAARPRARFNFSHDVNTTSDFGYVQPLMCKMLVAGSKTSLSTESLVRSAPLVSPVFGRMKAKINHHFVGMSDLIENFAPFMAQQQVSRSAGTFMPTKLPYMTLQALSALVLIGAKCTIYYSTQQDDSFACPYATSKVTANGTLPTIAASLTTSSSFWNSNYTPSGTNAIFDNYLGPLMAFEEFFDHPQFNIKLPIANYNANSFFDVDTTGINVGSSTSWQNWETVPLESADLLYTRNADYSSVKSLTFAFKLSSFGKHLRKILIGCGYQLDLRSGESVSLMPLLAYFKAYFDTYGLTLYNKWETTNCYKLCRLFDQQNVNNLTAAYDATAYGTTAWFAAFWGFVNDLGSCWYTDSQDFVSAHTVTNAVSPSPSALNPHVLSVDNAPHIDYSDISSILGSLSAPNGHAYIDAVKHGQLDSEYLKKLYIWTNRNTIAGQRIAELLRVQGLGKFVDEQKTNFIGAHEFILPVSDVTSTSDTYKPASANDPATGSLVGEVAGKSVEYNQSKTFSFENEEVGFWVTLFALVPESGYCQAIDKNVTCTEPYDFYRPDFDGLGYEATRKSQVVGAIDWSVGNSSDGGNPSLSTTFGFIPRGSAFKFAQNICNGDFSLRSTRNGYTTFFLDKLIMVGERYVTRDAGSDTTEKKVYWTERLLEPSKLPTASPLWRYVARYAWLGLYDRIFAQVGADQQRDVGGNNYWSYFSSGYSKFEYIGQSFDHFLMHNIFNMQYYAPMLPVEKSFETYDTDGEKPNSTVGKA